MFLENYLLEKMGKKPIFLYSSFEVRIDDPYIKHIRHLQSFINPKDLTNDGFEKNSHITILYGVKNIDKETIKNTFFKIKLKPFYVDVKNVHIFKSDKHDVIVLKCESPELNKLRNLFISNIPTIKQTHKEYIPHITLAYVKSGFGDKYKEILDKKFKNDKIKINYVYFSNKFAETIRYKLS